MEFPFVILLGGLITPFIVLCFCAFYWGRSRSKERVELAWQTYARRHRLTYLPSAGNWPHRSAPRIEWSEDGHAFRLEASGEETFSTTRLVARPAVAVLGELLVTGPAGEAARREGATPLDPRFIVWAQPTAFAERVLTTEVKRVLLGFGPKAFSYRRGEVTLGWAGGEENDARLDEARAVVRRVVAAMTRA
ncbi:MAG TPA: hypothetical protein VHV30_10340 [Polyangiaceae bacterium]|jgi:hypothetical protein|nr:hypothetical protein [Polyangiaceae bacterium]